MSKDSRLWMSCWGGEGKVEERNKFTWETHRLIFNQYMTIVSFLYQLLISPCTFRVPLSVLSLLLIFVLLLSKLNKLPPWLSTLLLISTPSFKLKFQMSTQMLIHGNVVFPFLRLQWQYLLQQEISNLTFNPLTPKIWLLILPSSCCTFPCKLVMRTWC